MRYPPQTAARVNAITARLVFKNTTIWVGSRSPSYREWAYSIAGWGEPEPPLDWRRRDGSRPRTGLGVSVGYGVSKSSEMTIAPELSFSLRGGCRVCEHMHRLMSNQLLHSILFTPIYSLLFSCPCLSYLMTFHAQERMAHFNQGYL